MERHRLNYLLMMMQSGNYWKKLHKNIIVCRVNHITSQPSRCRVRLVSLASTDTLPCDKTHKYRLRFYAGDIVTKITKNRNFILMSRLNRISTIFRKFTINDSGELETKDKPYPGGKPFKTEIDIGSLNKPEIKIQTYTVITHDQITLWQKIKNFVRRNTMRN